MTKLNPQKPLFEDPPDDLTEEDKWGFLIGGMASVESPAAMARAYKLAGDHLIDAALIDGEAELVAYPIIYLYRHAIEVYLKTITGGSKKERHDLTKLIAMFDDWAKPRFKDGLPKWVKDRLLEFAEIDPTSVGLRYVDKAGDTLPGEYWVNLRRFKSVIGVLADGFEQALNR